MLSKKSMQNKMLLNLVSPSKILTLENDISLLSKMKDGYNLKVNNTVLAILNDAKGMEHSLLGFVDKLKNGKVFPQGKQYLENIIWVSKIHLIKMIASGETLLNGVHILALYLYSSNAIIFENVNIAIAQWKENNLWNPFICCLYQASSLLPLYEGEVYRGINIPFNLKDLELGTLLKWNTFAICSREYSGPGELINMKKGIIFIIHSKTGRDIAKYSKNPVDSEIIFLPGTIMGIVNYYVADMICLAQANIRKSTFAVKESDVSKAVRGECSIIVELEEVLL